MLPEVEEHLWLGELTEWWQHSAGLGKYPHSCLFSHVSKEVCVWHFRWSNNMKCYGIWGRVIKCSKITVTVCTVLILCIAIFFSERQAVENLGVVSQQLFLPLSQTASWEIVFRFHTTTQYPEYLQGRWHHHTLNPHTRLEWDLVSQCYWLCSWKVLWKHQAKASKQHQVLPLLCFFYSCSWLPGLPLLQLHLLSLGSTTFIPLSVFFISLYSDIAKKITPFKAVPLR